MKVTSYGEEEGSLLGVLGIDVVGESLVGTAVGSDRSSGAWKKAGWTDCRAGA